MTVESILPFCLFAFVSSITPGPNNFMVLTSGARFGFKASLPHILGICSGFLVLLVAVGLGLERLFVQFPIMYVVMKWACAAYLLFLAWRIGMSGAVTASESGEKAVVPMSFLAAALFQWINPKAWAMATSGFSAYIPGHLNAGLVMGWSMLFAIIAAPCIAVWTYFGVGLRQWLNQPNYARAFNLAMATLLIASLVPLLRV